MNIDVECLFVLNNSDFPLDFSVQINNFGSLRDGVTLFRTLLAELLQQGPEQDHTIPQRCLQLLYRLKKREKKIY